jgi:hypothetical protein
MHHRQFKAAIEELGFVSAYAAAGHLGVSIRQAHRYAEGKSKVPRTLVILLHMYRRHGLLEDDALDKLR